MSISREGDVVEAAARTISDEALFDHDSAASSCSAKSRMTLLALALGTFCIGTTEFASMGIIQLFSLTLEVDLPMATHAVTAYAMGVVVGAPVLTLVAARLNRRTLLLYLIGIFVLGNVLSAFAPNFALFVFARFVSGLPQGAYFGAGAVVASHVLGAGRSGQAFAIVMTGLTIATIFGSPLATFLGQTIGWRQTYLGIAALGLVSLVSLWTFVPRTAELAGAPILHELSGLRKGRVWLMMVVAALGINSIFAVYTFIAPMVTDLVHLPPRVVPIALALFGIGMTVGNLFGGRLADRHADRGIILGYGCTLAILVVLGLWGANAWILFPVFFGVGATMMAAIPAIQVKMTGLGPESATLMGAMNLASLNVANALGALAGGLTIGAGLGLLSTAWAGFVLTTMGLILFAAFVTARTNQARLTTSGTSGLQSGITIIEKPDGEKPDFRREPLPRLPLIE
ncbi:MFS transporter [Rhizobium halophytocola]|uniref:DHA1 family inner membrane transport protein n=1 Tax=Rhizobium halophytocola TaxID=735519 RepID=A0ABS4E4P4_9HYPH|nr:MFS transporter [Rhizobium halophytocola]MBP1852909.1 DHA1 family inner membrane transport protein [Rhizobium halophytocola]